MSTPRHTYGVVNETPLCPISRSNSTVKASFQPKADDIISVLVEVPRGTPNKYELEKDFGLLALDRVLHGSFFYPGDYGFVPETLCDDGDPIDVLVLSNYSLNSGVVADCRVVGIMGMEDEKGEDYKVLAVVDKDPRSHNIKDISDLSKHRRLEIEHFFQNYKKLESKDGVLKWAKVTGFHDKSHAIKYIQQSRTAFHEKKAVHTHTSDEIYDVLHAPRDLFGITRAGAAPRRDKYPEVVQAYIECPKGCNNKYEFDHDLGCIKLDRVLHSAVYYPYDYGFIPRTLCGDGDPLDILVLSTFPLAVGTMVDVRLVGIMDMDDEKGSDAKALGVVEADPRYLEVRDLDDVADHVKTEIKHFFETYKSLESNKWAKVTSWRPKSAAISEVLSTAAEYDKNAKPLGKVPQLYHLPVGDKIPEIVNAVIECPKGSCNKYKFSKEVGLLKLDRVFHSSAFYPGNYGFIPQTLGEDGNPMDVLVLSPFPLTFQCLVEVRVVAMLSLVDERGPDSKIIGVPMKEPRMNEIQDLQTLPAHVKSEVENFFLHFKDLEDSQSFCRVNGWEDRSAALSKIKQGHELFFLFGLRMDTAENKIHHLERENTKLTEQVSSLKDSVSKLQSQMSKLLAERA